MVQAGSNGGGVHVHCFYCRPLRPLCHPNTTLLRHKAQNTNTPTPTQHHRIITTTASRRNSSSRAPLSPATP